jgi:hypothetical protein
VRIYPLVLKWLPVPGLWLAAAMLVAVVAGLERLAVRRSGRVFGIPVGTIVEDYPGHLAYPEGVDLQPHLRELATARWLSPRRLLLLPASGEVDVEVQGAGLDQRVGGGWLFVGELTITDIPGTTGFHTRVLLRIAPTIVALTFIAALYVPYPWGTGWPLDARHSWLWRLLPLLGAGGFFAWVAVRARTEVISAHHAATAALLAAALAQPPSSLR